MAERPILFSAPMVRAILAGTKTQTRRALRTQPPPRTGQVSTWHHPDQRPMFFAWVGLDDGGAEISACPPAPCPYGQPGDLLWVRETWRERVPDQNGRTLDYRADHTSEDPCDVPWRPSIFMPRWASRITLEVTGVRVDRLQSISEADALAEGSREWAAEQDTPARDIPGGETRLIYRQLWEQINGPASWDANPWVWIIDFKSGS